MKQRFIKYAVLAAAAGILAACSSYEEIPAAADLSSAEVQVVDSITVTFSATFEQPEGTRTSLDESNWKVKWTKDDKVTVIGKGTYTKKDKGTNKEFTEYHSANGNTTIIDKDGYQATISVQLPQRAESKSNDPIINYSEYYAVYPTFTASSKSNALSISTSLKSEQTATEGTFDNNVNIAAAKATSTNDFHFQNLCALLSFTVDTDIVSATLTSNSGTAMSGGTATISFKSDGTPKMDVGGGSSSVKLTGTIEKGKKYYFVVYPGIYTNGFTFEFKDKDGKTASMSSSNKLELAAKANVFLGAITIPPVKWMPSEVGVYSTDGTPEYSYQQYNDQLVWSVKSGVNGFRIQNMGSRRFFDISGLPATYTVEGTSDVSITENISTGGESTNTYNDTVQVISNDNGIVRLMGKKHLYIIKTK